MAAASTTPVDTNKADDFGEWSAVDTMVVGLGGIGGAILAGYFVSLKSMFTPFDFAFCLNIFAVVWLVYFYFANNGRLVNSIQSKTLVTGLVMVTLAFNVALQATEKLGLNFINMYNRRNLPQYQGGYIF
jgi:hypothetical protein